jgi:hypothetical protein
MCTLHTAPAKLIVGAATSMDDVKRHAAEVAAKEARRAAGLSEQELAVGFRAFSERYTSRVTLAPLRSVVAVASGTSSPACTRGSTAPTSADMAATSPARNSLRRTMMAA